MSASNLRFSIIIPLYNGSKTIGYVIDSILNQTFKNFELIIVDDLSDDDSVEIVKKKFINKINCSLIRSKHNNGPSMAIDKGIKHAAGEYLVFGAQDDMFIRNRLEIVDKWVGDSSYKIIISEDLYYSYHSFNNNIVYHH